MLKSLKAENFRALRLVEVTDLPPLTIILGPNDAGKTSLLRSINLILNPDAAMKSEDCSRGCEQPTTISATYAAQNGEHLRLRRRFDGGKDSGIEILVTAPELDIREFMALKVGPQADHLRKVGLTPQGTTKEKQQERYQQALHNNELPLVERYTQIATTDKVALLPQVEHFSTLEYSDAGSQYRLLLEGLVGTYVKEFFSQPEQSPVFDQLHTHVENALSIEIPKIQSHLAAHLGRSVTLDSRIDLSNILGSPKFGSTLRFDLGDGEELLHQRGAGTNKRAWLALQEYRSRVTPRGSYLRLYDEPDANLHYTAQRELHRLLRDATKAAPPTQVLIATHSVTLIDAVDPDSLIMLESSNGEATARRVGGATDVLKIFSEVGRSLGITNLALLYERAFILVEGPTEARALPLLYRRLYDRSLSDDGIVLVDLETCGAWRSVVNIIAANRKSMVRLLLDQDCTSPDSTAKLTPARLAEAGLDPSQFVYIGTKEFEDSFSDDCWARSICATFKRAGTGTWTAAEIAALRSADKFSDAVRDHVRREAVPADRSLVSKPTLGESLGATATTAEVPAPIKVLFEQTRMIAGIA